MCLLLFKFVHRLHRIACMGTLFIARMFYSEMIIIGHNNSFTADIKMQGCTVKCMLLIVNEIVGVWGRFSVCSPDLCTFGEQ